MSTIKIQGKQFLVADHENFETGYRIFCEDGTILTLFKTKKDAGDASKAFWLATAAQKPFYFMEVVGRSSTNPYAAAAEIFLRWNMNLPAGPGEAKTKSFLEWLDLFEKEPHYGKESECELSDSLSKELKFPQKAICYTEY